MALPELADFHLVGGTALSLQLGHRNSIDLDLFTAEVPFEKDSLLKILRADIALEAALLYAPSATF